MSFADVDCDEEATITDLEHKRKGTIFLRRPKSRPDPVVFVERAEFGCA